MNHIKDIYYHVVTEMPMKLGQKILFDENNHSGVYQRVYNLKNKVEDIYSDPNKYKNIELDHHTKVALRELAMEEIRQQYFKNYPSRLNCLYVSKTLEDAENWYDYFKSLGRDVFGIVKIKVNGNSFTGDAYNCFDGTIDKKENLRLAKKYWENKANTLGKEPIHETIVSGSIEVIEIVKE